MVRKVIWTKRALADKKVILSYWIERNKSVTYSKKLDQLFRKAIQIISDFPQIGKPTSDRSARIKVVKDYLIIYQRTGSTIYILTIWDCRQASERISLHNSG